MTQTEGIENFVAKARMLGAGDFDVDAENSILIRCEPGEYDRLELPPVETIWDHALEDVKAGEIIIPETVISINCNTFYGCKVDTLTILGNIKEVTGPGGADIKVKTINLGKNVTSIQIVDLINYAYKVEAINVSEDNPRYASDNGILYNKDFTRLVAYPGNHPQEEYIMPNTVKGIIGAGVFNEVKHLRKLKISDNVTKIEQMALYSCEMIEEIELGRGIEVIDMKAFFSLRSLYRLKTNGAIKEILNVKSTGWY